MNPVLDLVLYFGVLTTLVYLIYRYARYSKWEATDVGRAFMGMKVCLLALVLYAFTGVLGLEDPWRDILRVLVVGGIWAALTYQVVVMVRAQGGFRRNLPVRRSLPAHEPRESHK